MDYEIKIGTQKNFTTLMDEPIHTMIVSKEVFEALKLFANIRKDANLNNLYVINDIEFSMNPILKH